MSETIVVPDNGNNMNNMLPWLANNGYGNRYGNRYDGMRGSYGNRDWDDDDEMMGERRRYRRY